MKYSVGNRQNFKDTKNKNRNQTARPGAPRPIIQRCAVRTRLPKTARRPFLRKHRPKPPVVLRSFLPLASACLQRDRPLCWLQK